VHINVARKAAKASLESLLSWIAHMGKKKKVDSCDLILTFIPAPLPPQDLCILLETFLEYKDVSISLLCRWRREGDR
jgi:hypothetical protein